MSNKIDIAIIGATSPMGEALLEQLQLREFPIENLIPLDFEGDEDTTVEFAGNNVHVKNIAEFNFTKVSLVFLCQLDESYQPMVDRILDANCKLVEMGSNLQNAPTVVAEINADDDLLKQTQHIRSASGLAVVLSQLLHQINNNVSIKSLHFTALNSVSDKGKAGIDELAMQTTSLLNTRPIKPHVFRQQIAFNVMTDDGDVNTTGFTTNELDIVDELQTLLFAGNDSKVSVMPTFIHIPVFYGVSTDVRIELDNEMDITLFESLLSSNSNVEIKTEDDLITPVSHAAEMDKIFINRIRQDLHNPRLINFWCVTDTIKSGSAINGIQIAEILVKHHL